MKAQLGTYISAPILSAFLYHTRKSALFKSIQTTSCTICTTAVFNWRKFGTTREGKQVKENGLMLYFFFSFSQLCCAVQRKESDGVRKGKWGLLGQKVEKSENNEGRKHFALDFVRRSQSFPSISASCLPRFSSTDRKTHTHTKKTPQNEH